jgi:signal transduction histidine kinase
LAEALARTLRHEIGDFLQKIYASVAILQGRLPPEWDLERDILARLRHGAEGCKRLVDAVQDFLCPLTLTAQPLDLASLTAMLVSTAQTTYPQVQISVEAPGPALVQGDADRLTQVGRLLLANACEAARQQVQVCLRTDATARQVEWTVHDDGPGLRADLSDRLFRPFFTTRPGHAGLGLALARKIVDLHQGRIAAGNRSGGGFRAQVWLPVLENGLAEKAGAG